MYQLFWLCALVVFAAVEGITVGLTSIWFAAGALAALLAAVAGAQLWLQIVLFLAVSLLCLIIVRPLAKKYFSPKCQPTNADRLIGREGVVTVAIDDLKGQGQVKVGGQTWTARTGGEEVIPEGARVRALRIEGVKLYVALAEQAKEAAQCK